MIDQADKVAINLIDYSPLIGALIAGFFAVFGIIVANWLNSRNQKAMHDLAIDKEKRVTKLKKAEQLYLCMTRWSKGGLDMYTVFEKYISGDIQKLSYDRDSSAKKDHEEIHMLINLYFPELNSDFEDLSDVIAELSRSMRQSAVGDDLDVFIHNKNAFKVVTKKMLNNLSEICKNI
jgi:hypothetical protein